MDMLYPRRGQSQVQRHFDILSGHGLAEPPGDNITGIVIQYGRQIIPAPADNLQIGKIGLPELIDPAGRMFKLIFGRDQAIGRRGDQVVSLEDPIDAGFRDKIPLMIRDLTGDLPAGFLRILPGYLHHPLLLPLRNRIPDLKPSLRPCPQSIIPLLKVPPIPVTKRAPGHVHFLVGGSKKDTKKGNSGAGGDEAGVLRATMIFSSLFS